ncbi:MAG: DNA polymerase III subunit alpha [Candidatus Electryonea clarkiae]|nr:DNA polymerase III subunit alpha [Candidatus Electryonea clarkiae]MDP8287809.1 DNA polymerase III subunit alpha [Candidatus Electryonea clarkiae]
MSFVHLHNHTDYSFLDGATKVKDLCNATAEMGMPAVAMTDHGNLCGAIEFYQAAKKVGIKPIIGCELYLTDGSRKDKGKDIYGRTKPRYHLLLLVKNEQGYKNLMQLSSAGYLEGFYHRPRIDYEILEEHHEGLICLSGCIQSHLSQTLLNSGEKEASQIAGRYYDLFGEDFYLELQNHGIKDEIQCNRYFAELSKKAGYKLVATNDSHYLKKEHADPHDVLLCVQTRSDQNETDRFKFTGQEFYLKSPEEMAELFAEQPTALSNTLVVAEKVEFEFEFGKKHFPFFPLPASAGELSHDEYLMSLCKDGLPDRYDEVTKEIQDRLEMEIEIIHQKQLSDYFLIVRDFIAHAKEKGIPVGPGRGSAAGSLVSYLIGITNIDPIKYGLLFERFINPERESYPDIDVDFSDTRRAEVIEYVKKKYGEENVSQIITFGRMLAKGVIRDVGRVMNIPLKEIDAIAKKIPGVPKVTIQSTLDESPDFRNLLNSRSEYKDLLQKSLVLEGTIRNAGIHAAGVVITPEPLRELVPLYKAPDGDVTTQYDMNHLEEIGLLKVDFLGLKTLTILEGTLELLSQVGQKFTLDDIPIDDSATYRLFSAGSTIGIFQFESEGMRENLRKLKPERLEDLTAMNALYRPGPMKNISDFIARKHGRAEIIYLHPKMEEILDETYGVIVYQEQVMKIANVLAGMSLGRADVLRRAMGKKKQKLMDELQPEFIQGGAANGVSEKLAKKIWDLIEQFAKYGFNKSHAAGYALVAYQTGYLKTHYPAYFMAASMTTRRNDTDELIVLLDECRRMGIEVLPPDVNESEEDFTVPDEKSVRFGLVAVKNVGSAAIQAILGERISQGHFHDLFDLAKTAINNPLVNRKVLEGLVLAGATESLDGHRAQQYAMLEQTLAFAAQLKQEQLCGQVSIFGDGDDTVVLPRPEAPDVPEMPAHERLANEKSLLGIYFSGHPLLRYKREVEALSSINTRSLSENIQHDHPVRIAGLLTSIENRKTRKGDMMSKARFEDLTGTIPTIIFPKDYLRLKNKIIEDQPILLKGKISLQNENPEIIVEDIQPLEEAASLLIRGVEVKIQDSTSGKTLQDFEDHLRRNQGAAKIKIILEADDGNYFSLTSQRYNINPSTILLDQLEDILGQESVRLTGIG